MTPRIFAIVRKNKKLSGEDFLAILTFAINKIVDCKC